MITNMYSVDPPEENSSMSPQQEDDDVFYDIDSISEPEEIIFSQHHLLSMNDDKQRDFNEQHVSIQWDFEEDIVKRTSALTIRDREVSSQTNKLTLRELEFEKSNISCCSDTDSTVSVSEESTVCCDSSVDLNGPDVYDGSRRVRFSKVQIREYAVTIGDHPIARMYPLSLDWAHSRVHERSIANGEEYKEIPPNQIYRKAFRKPLRLDPIDRLARLAEVTGKSSAELYSEERNRQTELRKNRRQNNGFFQRSLSTVPKLPPYRSPVQQYQRIIPAGTARRMEYELATC